MSINEIGLDHLQFYINGQPQHIFELYELLFKHTVGIAITPPNSTEQAEYIQPRHLQQVGFNSNENILDYSQRTLSGYRLLIEQFLFPEKFHFFSFENLKNKWGNITNTFDIYIYFSTTSKELEKQVTSNNFQLNTTPIVNTFEQELEPISLDNSIYEYKLNARYLNPEHYEILSIDKITALNTYEEELSVFPFYSKSHSNNDNNEMFYTSRRESSQWAGGKVEPGSNVYISLVENSFQQTTADDDEQWVVNVKAQCSNRNLPAQLPFNSKDTIFFIPERADVIKEISCLIRPTNTVRPAIADESRWQLISHLNLDHFSGENAEIKLQEVLKLYNFRNTPDSQALINSIYKITIQPSTARVNQHGRISFCIGSDILIEFTGDSFKGSGIFFFASVLDHFFAQYAALNSFTRLSIKLKNQEHIYHCWPARTGTKVLL